MEKVNFKKLKNVIIKENFSHGCPALALPEDLKKTPIILTEVDLCAGRLDLAAAAVYRGREWELPRLVEGGPNNIQPLAWMSSGVEREFEVFWDERIPRNQKYVSAVIGKQIIDDFMLQIKSA